MKLSSIFLSLFFSLNTAFAANTTTVLGYPSGQATQVCAPTSANSQCLGQGGGGGSGLTVGTTTIANGTNGDVEYNNNGVLGEEVVSGTGTVTSVSVATANGFSGTVANASTTPAITMQTSITGILKGNGTAISAATSGTDYQPALSLKLDQLIPKLFN